MYSIHCIENLNYQCNNETKGMENLQRRKWRRLPVLGSVTLLALGVLLTMDNIETWVITELLWLVMRKDEKEEK